MRDYRRSVAIACAHVLLLHVFGAPTRRFAPPEHGVTGEISNEHADYLRRYGYADSASPPPPLFRGGFGGSTEKRSAGYYSDAIADLQRYAHINVTGAMDEATVRLINAPRCGLPDREIARPQNFARKSTRRWGGGGVIKWNWDERASPDLYRLSTVARPNVLAVFRSAFDTWSRGTALKFSRARRAEITLSFGRRHHGGCSYPFDGSGGVLAHAFYPDESSDVGGDVHFDSDEIWYATSRRRLDNGGLADGEWGRASLFHVALHEIGHAIGLSHSENDSSVMFPWYTTRSIEAASPKLPDVDSAAVRELYGHLYRDSGKTNDDGMKKRQNRPELETPVTGCGVHGPYDDIAYVNDELFVVKNGMLWRWYYGRPVETGTNRLSDHFRDLRRTDRVNAFHFDGERQMFIIVTGDYLYEYANGARGPTLRRRLSVRSVAGAWYFGQVETVLKWRSETLAFAGPYYLALDTRSMRARRWGYIGRVWPRGPASYQAAFTRRGRSYFISNDTYGEDDTDNGEFIKAANVIGDIVPGCARENSIIVTATSSAAIASAPLFAYTCLFHFVRA